MRLQLARREALLAALFPVIVLGLLNTFYKGPVHAMGPAWFWAADLAQFVFVPLACWLLVMRPAGITFTELRMPAIGQDQRDSRLSVGAIVFLAALLVAWTAPVFHVAWVFGGWKYADPFSIHQAIPKAFLPQLGVALFLSVTAALVEETCFRALPWLYFREVMPQKIRRTAYVLVTSLVFAMVHSEQGPGGVIPAFWFGVVAARMYTKTGSLWPVVLGHFIVDMIVFGPW